MHDLRASNTDRLKIAAAIVAAYLVAFMPLLFGGGEGLWLAKLLIVAGSPFLLLAVLLGSLFANAIKARPWLWSVAAAAIAVVTSTIALWLLTQSMIGLLSLLPALSAPVAFRIMLRSWDRLSP